jgi:hypothetical protein
MHHVLQVACWTNVYKGHFEILFGTLSVGLAYQGKENVLRFIIDYNSLSWDFGP